MIVIVSAITFTLLSSAGGDALSSLRDNPQISEKTIENLRRVYGLDRPFLERYGTWFGDAVRGDLGESISFRIPVQTLVWTRFKNTALMGFAAITIAIATAFALAIASVRFRSKPL